MHTSSAAVLLLAPSLTPARCAELAASGEADGAAHGALQAELEMLWPRAGFSAEGTAARRAFINRLGTRVGAVCG